MLCAATCCRPPTVWPCTVGGKRPHLHSFCCSTEPSPTWSGLASCACKAEVRVFSSCDLTTPVTSCKVMRGRHGSQLCRQQPSAGRPQRAQQQEQRSCRRCDSRRVALLPLQLSRARILGSALGKAPRETIQCNCSTHLWQRGLHRLLHCGRHRHRHAASQCRELGPHTLLRQRSRGSWNLGRILLDARKTQKAACSWC